MELNLGTSYPIAIAKGIALPAVFLAGALREVSDTGNLLKLTNIAAPLDRPSTVKIANSRIANVYSTLARGSVPLGNQSANTTGQSIFVEMTATGSKVSSQGSDVLLPVVCRVEVRLPNDSSVTDLDIKALVLATVSNLCDDKGNFRVTEMMRGVLPRGAAMSLPSTTNGATSGGSTTPPNSGSGTLPPSPPISSGG